MALLAAASDNAFIEFLAKALGVINQINTPVQIVALGLILLAFIFVVLMWKIDLRDKSQQGFAKTIVLSMLVMFFIFVLAALLATYAGGKKAEEIGNALKNDPQAKVLLKPLEIQMLENQPEIAGRAQVPQDLSVSLDELTATSLFYTKAGVTSFVGPATSIASLAILKDQPERAKEILDASLSLEPTPKAWNDLGVLYYNAAQGESDPQKRSSLLRTATEQFQKALAEDPKMIQAINNMGLIYYANDQIGEALFLFNEALVLNPDYLNAVNNRGLAYRKLGRNTKSPEKRVELLQKAKADFETVLEKAPNLPATHYNLALLLEHDLGNPKQAAEHYEKAIETDPGRAIAFNNLSFIYSQDETLRNPERAVDLAEKAVALRPDNPCFQDTLAHAYLAKEDCDKAIAASEKSLKQLAAATTPIGCTEEELKTSLEKIRRECRSE